MFRLSGVFSIMLAVGCGVLLFWTSQSVQRAEKRVSDVSRQAMNEEETLRVLTTEWDYLNRPERLEGLTYKSLDLDERYSEEKVILTQAEAIPEPVEIEAEPVAPIEPPKEEELSPAPIATPIPAPMLEPIEVEAEEVQVNDTSDLSEALDNIIEEQKTETVEPDEIVTEEVKPDVVLDAVLPVVPKEKPKNIPKISPVKKKAPPKKVVKPTIKKQSNDVTHIAPATFDGSKEEFDAFIKDLTGENE